MKKFVLLCIMSFGINSVFAETFYQNNNPFPQTNMQKMNNIYESEPNVIQKEEKKRIKQSNKKKNTNLQDAANTTPKIPVYPVNEGIQQDNGSYYMFTTGQ